MITSKQRAKLRAMANTLRPSFQIGKDGIGDNLIMQLDDILEARELIKVTVLETALLSAREACEECAKRLDAEPVQCIGLKFVLYRQARKPQNRKIEI